MRIQIPIFDEILGERNVPIATRPYRATDMLLKYCIRPEGDWQLPKIDDFLYGAFYYPVMAWYKQTYGREFLGSNPLEQDLVGLALLRGTLIELRIPMVVQREAPDEAHIDLQFPLALSDDEDPLKFLYPRPRLSSVRGTSRSLFVAQITETTNFLRRMINLAIGLDLDLLGAAELRDAFLENTKSTAVRAASGKAIPLSLFDLRMSCEILLKLHLLQRNQRYAYVHDFARLLNGASDEVRQLFHQRMNKELESYALHNARRYGDKLTMSTADFFCIYRETLSFLEDLLRTLRRKFVLDNAVVTLKRLSWVKAGPAAFGYPDL